MPAFIIHTGKIAVMNQDDVDTDRIIPARFLTMVTKTGYGELAFKDVRGPDFPLDQPEAWGASILVVGSNFGCGSSREHAVWAIQQAGFAAVIAKKTTTSAAYSDIFRSNAGNCGLALIELDTSEHEKLASLGSGTEIVIDLPKQEVRSSNWTARFEIGESTKDQLLKGLDLVGLTLEHIDQIGIYEENSQDFVPQATLK